MFSTNAALQLNVPFLFHTKKEEAPKKVSAPPLTCTLMKFLSKKPGSTRRLTSSPRKTFNIASIMMLQWPKIYWISKL